MKAWKIWTGAAIVVVLGAVSTVTAVLWNNVSSEWQVEQNAAQFALNHSPINHITEHSVFTASQAQEVFLGTDAFHRLWYAFVYGSPFTVQSVPAANLLTQTAVDKKVESQHIRPIQDTIGYLNPETQAACNTTATIVWEVYGREGAAGKFVYLFVDARTGKIVWKYVL